ncbi:hypothetical protein F4604DRAFT_1937512 [Suillus subluteus]|nr:hypothetical protein F4604DRAFT_1937512 [Suillus subluteus]
MSVLLLVCLVALTFFEVQQPLVQPAEYMCLQEVFQEARKVELSMQVGLMSTYFDVGAYHTHHCNAQSELFFLWAKMCHMQAEAAVYTLALENSPASTYSDSDSDSSPRPTLLQHLPEEVHHYMEHMDAKSIDSCTNPDLW